MVTSLTQPWSWACAFCMQPAKWVTLNVDNRIGACDEHGDLALAELYRIRREVERITAAAAATAAAEGVE